MVTMSVKNSNLKSNARSNANPNQIPSLTLSLTFNPRPAYKPASAKKTMAKKPKGITLIDNSAYDTNKPQEVPFLNPFKKAVIKSRETSESQKQEVPFLNSMSGHVKKASPDVMGRWGSSATNNADVGEEEGGSAGGLGGGRLLNRHPDNKAEDDSDKFSVCSRHRP